MCTCVRLHAGVTLKSPNPKPQTPNPEPTGRCASAADGKAEEEQAQGHNHEVDEASADQEEALKLDQCAACLAISVASNQSTEMLQHLPYL